MRSPCLAPNDNHHRIFPLCIVCHIVVQTARPTSGGLRAGGDMHGRYARSHRVQRNERLHEILPNEECQKAGMCHVAILCLNDVLNVL
jgi:hypothetical protein